MRDTRSWTRTRGACIFGHVPRRHAPDGTLQAMWVAGAPPANQNVARRGTRLPVIGRLPASGPLPGATGGPPEVGRVNSGSGDNGGSVLNGEIFWTSTSGI